MIAGFDEAVRMLAKMDDAPGVVFIREKDGVPEILATSNLEGVVFRSAHPVKFVNVNTGSSTVEAHSAH